MISDKAVIGPNVQHGPDFVVKDFATVKGDNVIGNHVHIYQYANIGLGTVIEDDVYIGAKSMTMNTMQIRHGRKDMAGGVAEEPVVIRRGARIGSMAGILPGVEIGEECLIGAGSLVTKSTRPYSVYYGNPAAYIKPVPPEEYLTPPVKNPLRIFITGCSKSGTTLLLRLFHAFEGVDLIEHEVALGEVINRRTSRPVVVGKRTFSFVFGNVLTLPKAEQQLAMVQKAGVKIVNIIRDGRDVVEGGYASVERWVEAVEQTKLFSEHITLNIRYEQLVQTPNVVQKMVEAQFGLTSKYKWSDYPSFLGPATMAIIQAKKMVPPRAIAADRVAKDLDKYRYLCPPFLAERMDKALKGLGYA